LTLPAFSLASHDDERRHVRRPGRVDHLLRDLLDVPRPIASTVMRVIGARRDRVRGDAVARHLLRGDDGERGDARLRGAVVRLPRVAEEPRVGRGVDERPWSCFPALCCSRQ
jgi:hypothetical protein